MSCPQQQLYHFYSLYLILCENLWVKNDLSENIIQGEVSWSKFKINVVKNQNNVSIKKTFNRIVFINCPYLRQWQITFLLEI